MWRTLMPAWDAHHVFLEPWTDHAALYVWILAMGILVGVACGLIGCFLILRRMALVGDAISHTVLLGLVLAFLVTVSRATGPMLIGAFANAGRALTPPQAKPAATDFGQLMADG